jgi:hypothetical protein
MSLKFAKIFQLHVYGIYKILYDKIAGLCLQLPLKRCQVIVESPTVIMSSSRPNHNLGYYYDIANGLFIVNLVIILVISAIYNIFVAISSVWMYKNHAWKNKAKNPSSSPPDSVWEEIYVTNLKIAKFVLGGSIQLKEEDGCLFLQIHDQDVIMPLAMILIQASQLTAVLVLIFFFLNGLVLQVYNMPQVM